MVCSTLKWCSFMVFLILPDLTFSLKNVNLQIEPRVVRRGDNVTLICTYELENDNIYSVKLYRGNREFFRYTPNYVPNVKTFPFANIEINVEQTDQHKVVIKNVDFILSGSFSCEVTTDAPTFSVNNVEEQLLVGVFPNDAPNVTTDKNSYAVGDSLKATCRSGPARPATTLKFSINNIVMCKHCETIKYPFGDLFYSEISMVTPLFSKYFNSNGVLKLRCSAQIAEMYQRDTDVILFKNTATSVPLKAAPLPIALILIASARKSAFL